MPVFDDYKEQFKSEIADFTNTGGRAGGAITGALFIKEFAGDLPWVHMDIAGTAWAEDAKPYQPKGATGVGVRTLVELALDAESWSKLKLIAASGPSAVQVGPEPVQRAGTRERRCSMLQVRIPIVVEMVKQPPIDAGDLVRQRAGVRARRRRRGLRCRVIVAIVVGAAIVWRKRQREAIDPVDHSHVTLHIAG